MQWFWGLDNSRNNSEVEHLYLKKEIVGRHTIRSLILKGFLRKCEAEDAVFFSAPGTALLFTSRHSCACTSFLSSDHGSMAAAPLFEQGLSLRKIKAMFWLLVLLFCFWIFFFFLVVSFLWKFFQCQTE